MMSDAVAHLKAATSVIVIRDLDDWDPRDLGRWLDDTLTTKGVTLAWEAESPAPVSASERLHLRDVRGENGVARLVLVGVGLHEDDSLSGHYPIERFTMDDYLLRLVADSEVYDALTEIRREVPYEKAVSKLDEIGKLMDSNGLPIRLSKRYLQFLRAIAGFRASPAEFALGLLERAVGAKAESAIRTFFLPFLDDLEVARGLIGSAPTAAR